ncbi:unnamed protein product (macronuclear) [Paramecium tetraurelia]|uniref:PX domain-containing protein n=1 Tax=Paramecium tetraurelia TaxID=5888 RepID=A0D9M1_PARTE|nr:uncharacterized protein GSPATT00014668001 [Paramecium tetraurelia]CAK79738.1 unnamed protein product [Paramecium tetraurelia]|eukprot:XP_001447135.1 hypothetical protein (macronuclear) [Paramecium tetraurelia strain d4-2]
MNKKKYTPRSRRFSTLQDQTYILPKLFQSVDFYQKQKHSVRMVSNQKINNLTFLHRNINYQTSKRSIQQESEEIGIQENNKVYEVKIQVKFVKHKQKLEKQLMQDFRQDFKFVRFPNAPIKQIKDEIELSQKLQRLLAKIKK